jgi:hypothetical protein
MPKTIQVRNVPDQLHRTLKVRAAREGMSFSDFINRGTSHHAGVAGDDTAEQAHPG